MKRRLVEIKQDVLLSRGILPSLAQMSAVYFYPFFHECLRSYYCFIEILLFIPWVQIYELIVLNVSI